MITIDEAIQRCWEISNVDFEEARGLDKRDFEQISNWLEELKEITDSKDSGYNIGYTKAIDDVMAKAKEIQEQQIKNLEQYPKRYGKQWAMYMNTHLAHIQVACKRLIAEQLKEGSADNE